MELEGSLKAFSLPEVLQFLAMSKMTGCLSVTKSDNTLKLIIRHGRIVNSSTFERKARVGQLLVYRGVIQRRQLQEVLDYQRRTSSDKRLGELLIEKGLLTEETLKQTLKLQLEEEVWNLFDCTDGEFKFEHMPPEDILVKHLEIDIEPLIIEGSRRLDEWVRIKKELDSEELVMSICELPENWEPEMKLTENEWKVLSMVNGFYSVGSLIRRSCLGKFETCRILFNFLTAGIIQHKPPAKERPVAAVAPTKQPLERAKKSGAPASAKGLSQLLGFRRASATDTPPPADRQQFSPVSALCELIDRYLETCATQRDFGSLEPNLVEKIWTECVNLYPFADLINCQGNHLSARAMEDYVELCGPTKILQPCYEDGLEALELMLSRVYMLCSQRLGEKHAQRCLRGHLAELNTTRSDHPLFGDFSLEGFVEKALPIHEGVRPHGR